MAVVPRVYRVPNLCKAGVYDLGVVWEFRRRREEVKLLFGSKVERVKKKKVRKMSRAQMEMVD